MADKSKVSVYSLMQAEFEKGKWNKSKAKIQREGIKIHSDDADLYNSLNFDRNGSYYEVDKDRTEAYNKAKTVVSAPKKKGKSKK